MDEQLNSSDGFIAKISRGTRNRHKTAEIWGIWEKKMRSQTSKDAIGVWAFVEHWAILGIITIDIWLILNVAIRYVWH